VKYTARLRHATRSHGASQQRRHRQQAGRMAERQTRRIRQNPRRWVRVELRKARYAAWLTSDE